MDPILKMMQELIDKVDNMTEAESEECLKELKKWENIGPTVQEYFANIKND